jgi:hypothetical protein
MKRIFFRSFEFCPDPLKFMNGRFSIFLETSESLPAISLLLFPYPRTAGISIRRGY